MVQSSVESICGESRGRHMQQRRIYTSWHRMTVHPERGIMQTSMAESSHIDDPFVAKLLELRSYSIEQYSAQIANRKRISR